MHETVPMSSSGQLSAQANSSGSSPSALSKALFLEAAGQSWPAASRNQALLREDAAKLLLFAFEWIGKHVYQASTIQQKDKGGKHVNLRHNNRQADLKVACL